MSLFEHSGASKLFHVTSIGLIALSLPLIPLQSEMNEACARVNEFSLWGNFGCESARDKLLSASWKVLLAGLPIMIIFYFWLAAAVRRSYLREYTPHEAVASFLIPIVNVFRPPFVVAALWRASGGSSKGARFFAFVWWGCCLVARVPTVGMWLAIFWQLSTMLLVYVIEERIARPMPKVEIVQPFANAIPQPANRPDAIPALQAPNTAVEDYLLSHDEEPRSGGSSS